MGVAIGRMDWANALDNKLLDRFFLLRGIQKPSNPLALVTIDELSMDYAKNALKYKTFSRNDFGKAMQKLRKAGAKTVAIDWLFDERTSRREYEDYFLKILPELKGMVCGSYFTTKSKGAEKKEEYRGPIEPYSRYIDSGFANVGDDPDHILRSAILDHVVEGRRYFSFALVIAAKHLNQTPEKTLEDIPKNRFLFEGKKERGLRINFAGPDGTFPSTSFYEVLQNSDSVNKFLFADKIAIIGHNLITEKNRFGTPFSSGRNDENESLYGAEVHANIVNTILNKGIANASPGYQLIWAAVLALASLIGARSSPWRSYLLAPGAILAAILGPYLLFAHGAVWIRVFPGLLSAILGASPYLLSAKARWTATHRQSLALAVIDMCDSSSISNRFGNAFATRLKDSLRELLLRSGKAHRVAFYKGTGDGMLLAFDNVTAALNACVASLNDLAVRNEKAPKSERIDVRMAIHFGEVNFVSVGKQKDIEGDAVNTVCRIEGLKSDGLIEDSGGITPADFPLKNRIFISEAAYDEIRGTGKFDACYIGFFDLKGIRGRHRIYWVVAPKSSPKTHPA